MKLEYNLQEPDYLEFHLFNASQSKSIQKKKKTGWIIITAGSIAVSLYFYFKQDMVLTIYFGLVAIISGLFYPKYFHWRETFALKTAKIKGVNICISDI